MNTQTILRFSSWSFFVWAVPHDVENMHVKDFEDFDIFPGDVIMYLGANKVGEFWRILTKHGIGETSHAPFSEVFSK